MTEKYRKIVNAPIKQVGRKFKSIAESKSNTKSEQFLRASKLVGLGLLEFIMYVFKFTALDNKALRAVEKQFSKVNVDETENNKNKIKKFLNKNPNLAAVMFWWAMLTMLGATVLPGHDVQRDEDKNIKKEIKIESENKNNNSKTISFDDARLDETNLRQKEIEKKLGSPIKMTNAKVIKQAVMDNFAYIQAVLFSTENYRTDWFSDNKSGKKNTLGVGLYYLPVKPYDFKSAEWIYTTTMYNKYPKLKNGLPRCLTDDEVYDGIKGWFFYMDNGYNFKCIQNALAGHNLSLTPRDLTVISSVLFNSPDCAKKFCEYIVDHPKNRMAWAKYLLQVDDDVSKTRLQDFPGLKSRRVHEILLLLNIDNYCQDMFGVQIDGHVSTAVSNANNYFDKLCGDFSKSNLVKAKKVICNGVVANGVSVCQCVARSEKYRDAVFAYCANVDKYMYANLDRQKIYDAALKAYKGKDYESALRGFTRVIEMSGVSPDLFNDLAITYIHIGDYEKSIEMSMRALEICSGDYESAAYFNLGLAYENIGDINNALKNYISAMRLGNNTAKSRVLKIMPVTRLFGI